jgi:PEGA domain/Putative binding domain, N-terminal
MIARRLTLLICVLPALFASARTSGQSAQAACVSVSFSEVAEYLKISAPVAVLRRRVAECGVGFSLDAQREQRLVSLGATPEIISVLRAANASAPRPGVLVVSSEPQGARVSVDGQPRGSTPLTLRDVAPGTHHIVLAQAGYLDNGSDVQVRTGETTTVDRRLTRAPANASASGGSANAPAKSGVGNGVKIGVPLAIAGAVGGGLALKGGGSKTDPVKPEHVCTFSFSVGSLSLGPNGMAQSATLNVEPSGCSNPSWTITAPSFLSVAPASGSGTQTVSVSASTNTGGDRNGTVSANSATLNVTQRGLSCTYRFVATDCDSGQPACPGSPTWSVGGGPEGIRPRHVGVDTQDLCPWSASTNVPWIHLAQTSGTGGTPFGSAQGIVITIDPTTVARDGIITFTGGATRTTFTVHQRGPGMTALQ